MGKAYAFWRSRMKKGKTANLGDLAFSLWTVSIKPTALRREPNHLSKTNRHQAPYSFALIPLSARLTYSLTVFPVSSQCLRRVST